MFTRLRRLPVTAKVPLVVVLAILAVSVFISERVLTRLAQLQRDHVSALAETYLDGLSSSLLPAVLRDDIWEAFDALDRSRELYASLRPVETIVARPDGTIIAATDPEHAPAMSRLPVGLQVQFGPDSIETNEEGTRAFLKRDLVYQDRSVGTVFAVLDIAHLVAERRLVLWTLVATNAALALLFAGLGYLAVNRMVRPVRVLSDHLEEGLRAQPRPIGANEFPDKGSPFQPLFASYNALVASEREREGLALRLAEEEKIASLGRLASGMAHEINNPLGGLLNAIDTLKAHGDKPMVRATSLSLIERGLSGIREVVQAALATYRIDLAGRSLTPQDMEDLRLLLGPELKRRSQSIIWHSELGALPHLPGTPVRQAVLNLLLNASAASGEGGRVSFAARQLDNSVIIEVEDSGPGMPDYAAAVLTARAGSAMVRNGRGLGLSMVRRLVDELGGKIELGPSELGGAKVRLLIPTQLSLEIEAHVA